MRVDPAIERLLAEGYDLVVEDATLTVRDVPHVTRERVVRRGELVLPLAAVGGRVLPPRDGFAWFRGDTPCDADGNMLGFVHPERTAEKLGMLLCLHPAHRGFRDHHEAVTMLVNAIERPARSIRPEASAKGEPGRIAFGAPSPFEYGDDAVAREGTTAWNDRLRGGSVGIVGLGGTGSYVLDLVAKTPVDRIHLFDDDAFLPHNAFRTPGAASADEFEASIAKVDRMADVYSRMHRGIVPHRARLDGGNLHLLDVVDFAFVCVDDPVSRHVILGGLRRKAVPCIDCGIGLRTSADGLLGLVRTTVYPPGGGERACDGDARPPLEPSDDPYRFRAQVADLNALNAALAVTAWKRSRGFYGGLPTGQFAYVIDGNLLVNAPHG